MARNKRSHRWLRIRRVGIISAFKMGCFMAALPTICFLVGIVSMALGFIPGMTTTTTTLNMGRSGATQQTSIAFSPANALLLLPAIIAVGLVVAIGPAITLAIQAFIYNLFGRFFGGIIIRVDEAAIEDIEPDGEDFGKPKRTMTEDEFVAERLAQRRRAMLKNDPSVREL